MSNPDTYEFTEVEVLRQIGTVLRSIKATLVGILLLQVGAIVVAVAVATGVIE